MEFYALVLREWGTTCHMLKITKTQFTWLGH